MVSAVEEILVVSGKSQNQVGVAAESRTLDTRDIGKVNFLDVIVC